MKEPIKNEEFEAELGMDQLLSVALLIVVITVAVAIGANLTDDLGSDFTAGSAARNATDDGQAALGELTSKLTIVATTVVGIVLLALVARIVTLRFG